MKKEALRVSSTLPVAPTTLYLAWLSAEQHSAMTGGAAKIDATVGGKYTAWNGYISGKLVILDLGRRIVMSWRTTDFPREAPDSRVEIHFEALGGSTRVLILHTDIPEGQAEQYRVGWNEKYFNPMLTFFTKYLPDPRKPPPPRRPPPPEEEEEEEETPSVPPKKGSKAIKSPPPPPSKKPLGKAPPERPEAPPPQPSKKVAEKPAPTAAAKPAPKAPEKPAPKKPAPKAEAKPTPKAPEESAAKKPAAKKPAAKPAKKK
jgi:hypothetical protein